ncbi:MAG: aminopeptidase P family N-terminal domain-containing protein, partial [Ginsengibacter sp.]
MNLKRKDFIKFGALAVTANALPTLNSYSAPIRSKVGESTLSSLSIDAKPISVAERELRIAKAQKLLVKNNMGALILDSGTSLEYFTGITWWPSERTMVAIIPAKGTVKYVCPAFEEDRFREQVTIGKDVSVWQEDESPFRLIVKVLQDAGVRSGNIGIEERVRFFIVDGIQKVAPQLRCVSGDPITIPCRIIKSEAELALMQKANDITLAAIQQGVSQLKEGMTQGELSSIIMSAQRTLG